LKIIESDLTSKKFVKKLIKNSDNKKSMQWTECVLNADGCGMLKNKPNFNKLLTFAEFNLNLKRHCEKLKINVPNLNESILIQNRIGETYSDTQKLCPKHRFNNGICWQPQKSCKHPTHVIKKKVKCGTSQAPEKLASFIAKKHIQKFPIGSTICWTCRLKASRELNQVPNITTMAPDSELCIEDESDRDYIQPIQPKADDVENFNKAMEIMPFKQTNISPIKYQVTKPFASSSVGEQNKLKRKLKTGIDAFAKQMANTLCPSQGEILLNSVMQSSVDNEETTAISTNLINAVANTENRQLKAMLISTVAKDNSISKIMDAFKCSKSLANLSRTVASYEISEVDEFINPPKRTRKRLDMQKVEHFIDFLFLTGFLQDIAFGTTKIKMSNGKFFEIPHAVRTIQQGHIITAYHNHTKHMELSSPCASTLRKILASCNASQKKGVQGLDSFIAAGVDGFKKLKEILDTCDAGSHEVEKVIAIILIIIRYLILPKKKFVIDFLVASQPSEVKTLPKKYVSSSCHE
jgi:hypothetical protein